jgi:hypothetical protein
MARRMDAIISAAFDPKRPPIFRADRLQETANHHPPWLAGDQMQPAREAVIALDCLLGKGPIKLDHLQGMLAFGRQ